MGLSGQGGSLGLSVAPPGSVVVPACHDDHQKVKGFLLKHDYWGSVSHLMLSGSTIHIVATWLVLIGGSLIPYSCVFRVSR